MGSSNKKNDMGDDRAALTRDYQASGFGTQLGYGEKPALLVIDVVDAYHQTDSPLYAGVEETFRKIVETIDALRALGIPIIFTRVEYQPGGLDGGLFYRKVKALSCFDRGNPLGRFPSDLPVEEQDLIVTKQYASAFFGTSLASTLRTLGCDTTLICGYTTSGCVRASALDALQNGFLPIVIGDASGDRSSMIQEANLFDLQAKYADIVDSRTVISHYTQVRRKP